MRRGGWLAAHEEWCALGLPPDLFWQQTPRINASTLDGALRRERREFQRLAVASRWIGSLSQVHPKHYPTVDAMMGIKSPPRVMTGDDINAAMEAWVRRTEDDA